MGRDKGHHRKKHRHSRSPKHPLASGPAVGASSSSFSSSKLLKYASLGKTRKLRALLLPADGPDAGDPAAVLNAVADSSGATALHQAARHGHLEVVQMLLRRGADPSLCDTAGNSPGHLAAMHGHWLVLTELVKAADVDLDKPNAAGFTTRQIVQQQRQQAADTAGPPAPNQDTGSPSSSMASDEEEAAAAAGSSRAAAGGRAGAAAAAAGAGSAGQSRGRSGLRNNADDEADWMDKLAYEMSYDDGSGWQSAWGDAMAAAAAGGPDSPAGPGRPYASSAAAATNRRHKQQASASARTYGGRDSADRDDGDDDDAWADRLWQDMQEHRRQAAAAKAAAAARDKGSTRAYGPSSRDEAAQERERKAAAAATESARILKEEQAKDADWRAAMMRQVEEAALPMRQATYEQRWQQLAAWPAGKLIRHQDIPWPCPLPGSQAAARRQQGSQALQLDQKQLQALVLAGAKSAADVKLALRKELMRWHPDKFTARYGARLDPVDKEAIQAGVHAVAQQLTSLKQQ